MAPLESIRITDLSVMIRTARGTPREAELVTWRADGRARRLLLTTAPYDWNAGARRGEPRGRTHRP